MRHDITHTQFERKCAERGFTRCAIGGYYRLPCGVSVYAPNAGLRRRSQLAYLITADIEWEEKKKSGRVGQPGMG